MAKVIRLTENQFGEMMAYHGSGADFNKFNHKKYLNTGAGSQSFGWGTYITNDKVVADGYVNVSKKNRERDFFVNLDPKPYLESLGKYDEGLIKEILREYDLYVVQTFQDAFRVSYNAVLDGLKIMVDYEEQDLHCYLPLDRVIKMYKEDPRFDYMSDEEKEAEIEAHRKILAKKERPLIVSKACVDILKHFKPEMDKYLEIKKVYLYEVDIPDDNGFNYLSWYDKPTIQQQEAIKDGLLRLENKYKKKILTIYSFIDGERLYRDLNETFARFIGFINRKGEKAASLFLMQCGFDGIKYPSGTKWQKPDGASEDAYNYVIFDANKVKIINKTAV